MSTVNSQCDIFAYDVKKNKRFSWVNQFPPSALIVAPQNGAARGSG